MKIEYIDIKTKFVIEIVSDKRRVFCSIVFEYTKHVNIKTIFVVEIVNNKRRIFCSIFFKYVF